MLLSFLSTLGEPPRREKGQWHRTRKPVAPPAAAAAAAGEERPFVGQPQLSGVTDSPESRFARKAFVLIRSAAAPSPSETQA